MLQEWTFSELWKLWRTPAIWREQIWPNLSKNSKLCGVFICPVPSTLSQFHTAMKPTACNHSGKSPATRRERRGLEFLKSPIHRKLSLPAMSGGSLENSSTKLSLFGWLKAHLVQTAYFVLFLVGGWGAFGEKQSQAIVKHCDCLRWWTIFGGKQ